jgi:hypothetical protein
MANFLISQSYLDLRIGDLVGELRIRARMAAVMTLARNKKMMPVLLRAKMGVGLKLLLPQRASMDNSLLL